MSYISLQHAINDLKRKGDLLEIDWEVDPYLEMAEIHRRVYDAQGPAILFHKVKGSPFKAVSNLYGTYERTRFLFRNELPQLRKLTELKADPALLLKNPRKYLASSTIARHALPKKSRKSFPFKQTTIDQLPRIVSWPDDGGAFITLPQVFTLPPGEKSPLKGNIGMYRIQLDGNDYIQNEEIGLHYQLHRGIGVHHRQYMETDEEFKVSIFVGGPPSHTFVAIMPLPEGMSEVTFAGLLNSKSWRYKIVDGYMINVDADFVITGTIKKNELKPEGPFGDHLGYYSLKHDFPVMKVDKVYYKEGALWHFTVVGRPPAEDSNFGKLIHDIVEPITTAEFPGLHSVNAVDAAGVHPLLLAVGSERYMPFRQHKAEEVLTIAHHLLGKGQTSLAKYLLIANQYDDESLDAENIPHFFQHFLERVDFTRDLHFMTKTTIDTLDYSGGLWNEGSKVVIAAVGEATRALGEDISEVDISSQHFSELQYVMPGVIALSGSSYVDKLSASQEIETLTQQIDPKLVDTFPLIVIVDDAKFVAEKLNNFLWVVFTRSNPAEDIHGVGAQYKHKHWYCNGSLIIDARTKPHHAPELIPDSDVSETVDIYFDTGGPLSNWNSKS